MKLDLEQVARWTGGTLHGHGVELAKRQARGYSIDSRTLQQGDLFFAVRGERFDAHDFVAMALERGACAAVVAKNKVLELPEAARQQGLVIVEDPLTALQTLAAAVRRHWGRRVVGVTGSAGKTTTKEAIAAVLGMKYVVLKSQGNLNNGYGLPLQLLRLETEHEIAVIEMGMSHSGEITALARIAAPNWGVVTNVGNAHAENFSDGTAGVARAKYELIASLPAEGVAFLNCDDAYVSQFGRDFRGKTVYFGRGPCADPRAESVEEMGTEGLRIRVRAGQQEVEARLQLLGQHNAANAMAAIAVGLEAGVPLADCTAALAMLRPGDKRGEAIRVRGATLINDCYNSNPEALKAMVGALMAVPGQRHILIAGEMLELGQESAALHESCGEAAAAAGVDLVVGVRGQAALIAEGAKKAGAEAIFVESPELAGAWLNRNLRDGDAVLLKASRGVRLEKALESLRPE
ncbi:MAG: UDP-N-acetylmuramoyl-tripeptide--D-alanyl-D-alanine ligase [Acidobacterium ailaaui]|jgi:UDP-N-acetylmuramoyl-tripeptide--D-alanyl-D-alanine ligase|nr:UDP-N-acetylmuramoyl-tripeptide--D-alanyl-D-alanine ligase [Pseudacidobacterium ailaaui]MCL6462926.1 UDP-N-acetylmuramoyl-tripeptide--D-alanyl-D-alanine ligase [Pseudacidobacterium ailaaui]MDI3254603.1 UDP-N-acetylmuramoyl-tripeptide--D-alanyl-D-alanine ligase [Bacillota bacterium]